MYLVTIQPKKQGEFEPIRFVCSDETLLDCINCELMAHPNAVAIIDYINKY